MDVTTEICDISPDLARDMLGKNTHNRNIRARHVTALANDMRDGNWQLNGDAIKFDTHGVLLDGQHRLLAVIEADVTVPMMLVWNVQPSAQLTYDVGARRTFSDVLTLMGETNATTLATTVRWHYIYGINQVQGNPQVTYAQLLAHFNEHRGSLREGARLATQVRYYLKYPASAMSTTFAEILIKGEHADQDLDDFVGKLKSGADMKKGNPILALRQYAINTTMSNNKPTPVVMFAIFIKVWNAYIEGRTVGYLAFRSGGASPEQFPVIM